MVEKKRLEKNIYLRLGPQVLKLGIEDEKFKKLQPRLHRILMLNLIKTIFNLL